MRHQSNKRAFHNPHQKRHFQRGEGKFTDALKKVGKKTKDAVIWSLNNMKELATLGKAGYDIYQGRDPTSALNTLKKAHSVLGKEQQDALLKLIQNKKEEVKTLPPNSAKKEKIVKEVKVLEKVEKAKNTGDLLKEIQNAKQSALKRPPPPPPKKEVGLMRDIKTGVKLRSFTPKTEVPMLARPSSMAGMLEAIKQRRGSLYPPDEMVKHEKELENDLWDGSGYKAKNSLLKLVKKSMKMDKKAKMRSQLKQNEMTGYIMRDKSLPSSKGDFIVGSGSIKPSDVAGGISGVSGVLSKVNNPHLKKYAMPISIVSGVASAILKMFGKGMKMRGGSLKGIKTYVVDRLKKGAKDAISSGKIGLKNIAKDLVKHSLGHLDPNLQEAIKTYLKNSKYYEYVGSGMKKLY
jgi:hypothetical protein